MVFMTARNYQDLGSVFAKNVKARRAQFDLSQSEVARQMKERGFAFHQQTIQRIEDGQRPVKLEEAYALGDIFGIGVEALSWNLNNVRNYEVQQLGNGALSLMDGIVRGSGRWWYDAAAIALQVIDWLEEGREAVRVEAGLELLRRTVVEIDSAEKLRRRVDEEFFTAIYPEEAEDEDGSGDEDIPADEREEDEARKKIRDLLEQHGDMVRKDLRSWRTRAVAELYVKGDPAELTSTEIEQ